jgi:catalase
VDEDYYTQPGLLFRLMSAEQKNQLYGNTARAMGDAPQEVKIRQPNQAVDPNLKDRWSGPSGVFFRPDALG